MEALDIEAFRSWLEDHDVVEVGIAGNVERCPLAAWLTDVHGCRWWAGPGRCGDEEGNESLPLPRWASYFVGALDIRYRLRGPVTGREALAVLDEVVSW